MTIKSNLAPLVVGALALIGWAAPAPAAEAAKKSAGACAECHEQAAAFFKSPHGRSGPSGEAACTPCHGEGTKHAEAGGDKALIKRPSGREGAETCLTCHDKTTDQKTFRDGVHQGTSAVNCLTCHSIHGGDPRSRHLLVKDDPALCASCHPAVAASFANKPYAHRMGRGMQCTSCHEPHGRHGRDSVKLTRAGEIACLSCHTGQRGPYVFSHVVDAAGDCTTCHEPHGSSNPKQLVRAQVYQLCIECHTQLPAGTTFGSMAIGTHNTSLPRWRSCTTCHVAVHGSNRSPRLLK